MVPYIDKEIRVTFRKSELHYIRKDYFKRPNVFSKHPGIFFKHPDVYFIS